MLAAAIRWPGVGDLAVLELGEMVGSVAHAFGPLVGLFTLEMVNIVEEIFIPQTGIDVVYGAPERKASSRNPNLARASSSEIPRAWNTRCWTS